MGVLPVTVLTGGVEEPAAEAEGGDLQGAAAGMCVDVLWGVPVQQSQTHRPSRVPIRGVCIGVAAAG